MSGSAQNLGGRRDYSYTMVALRWWMIADQATLALLCGSPRDIERHRGRHRPPCSIAAPSGGEARLSHHLRAGRNLPL